jgi:transcription antitermination factor NusG
MSAVETKVYVVVVGASDEKRAVEWLLDHNVAAYTPIVRRWRWLCGHRVRNERPLFPRHVFVASANIAADRAAVSACRYVQGFVGCVGEATPRPIDAAVMGCKIGVHGSASGVEWLTWWLVAQSFGLLDHTRPRKPALTIGQLVRIIGGPFKALGYSGVVSELRGARLVVIPKVGGKLVVSAADLEVAA